MSRDELEALYFCLLILSKLHTRLALCLLSHQKLLFILAITIFANESLLLFLINIKWIVRFEILNALFCKFLVNFHSAEVYIPLNSFLELLCIAYSHRFGRELFELFIFTKCLRFSLINSNFLETKISNLDFLLAYFAYGIWVTYSEGTRDKSVVSELFGFTLMFYLFLSCGQLH